MLSVAQDNQHEHSLSPLIHQGTDNVVEGQVGTGSKTITRRMAMLNDQYTYSQQIPLLFEDGDERRRDAFQLNYDAWKNIFTDLVNEKGSIIKFSYSDLLDFIVNCAIAEGFRTFCRCSNESNDLQNDFTAFSWGKTFLNFHLIFVQILLRFT